MGNKKTLIILSPGFAKDESDSTCMPAQQSFVRAVNKHFPDIKVIIIALQYPYTEVRYEWFENEIIPYNSKATPRLLRPIIWIKVLRMLSALEKRDDVIGIISLWFNETAWIGNYFSRSKNIKHLIWILGQDARASNRFPRWFKTNPESLVALSDSLKHEFAKHHGITPAHIIPNGVDLQPFAEVDKIREIDIIGVGSLTTLKRYSVFVEVIKTLTNKFPNLKVSLVGDGDQRTELQHQIQHSKLQENITVTGELAHDTVIDLMKRAKILLHPSSYEGYSTVCLEALAAGCHVVSFVRAEDQMIRHWHIVNDLNEMIDCCNNILEQEKDFSPMIVHAMDDSAKAMIHLLIPQNSISSD